MRVCVWFLSFSLFLESHLIDREIIVSLEKAEPFDSIYLSCQSPSLKRVLLFDLNHSGVAKGYVDRLEEERELQRGGKFSPLFWKQKGYHYLLKVEIGKKSALATLFSMKTGGVIPLSSHSLTGNSSLDRRVMHKIADQVYEALTQKKGVANSKIYYALQLPEGKKWKSEIWAADYDGKNARQLTEEKSYCISPTLFPVEGAFTKNKYLYVNYKLGQPKIYIASFDSPKGKPFLSLRGNQLLPSISPRGDLMAFISDAGGQADLFLQAISPEKGLIGKPLQLYSFPRSVQASPTFRPDGKKIAFVSDQEGTPRIFLIDIPSLAKWKRPHPVCLTRRYRENTCPSWSPDGTKLAYSAKINGYRQIMVYNFMTSEEIQLTTGKRHKENPCWAPNGSSILFNTVESSSELFFIQLKQKKMVQISEGLGKKHYPAWGP